MDQSEEVVDRLEALLFQIAAGLIPNRAEAIAYSHCRSELLQSPMHDLLPGFLYQCLTIFKFKDFITLYDPDSRLREAFIRRMFDRCRSLQEQGGAAGQGTPLEHDALDPGRWML